jgi:multiple sugar transport system permease protein
MAVLAQTPVQHSTAFRLRKLRGQILFWFVLGLFIIFACFPVYWMFVTTFKQVNDLYNLQNNPLLFHLAPTLDQVQYLFERTNFSTWVINTGEVGLAVVVITVLICVPAAYVLARSQFPGSGSLGMGIFLTYLVPPTLLFLPLSQLVVGLGLVNDKWSLALVYPTFTIPFCTWLLMGFFKNVPREITEAARVDGCSRLGAMFRIVLPLSVPAIASLVIFQFLWIWNDLLVALIYVGGAKEVAPLTVSLANLTNSLGQGYHLLTAAAFLSMVVPLIVFVSLQRYFVRGILAGSVKG